MKDRKLGWYIWYLLIFVGMYVWFTQVHPLVVFDSDDWSFISFIRRGFPMWGDWNPARVLPETLMPMVSNIAVHLLYPKTGDYLGAITSGSAVAVSLMIVLYVWCFAKMMERVFTLSKQENIAVSAIFLVLHFLAMRSQESGNQYLFYCWDLTCYYFYLIPSLLNASVVMTMIRNARFEKLWLEEGNWMKKGLFLLVLYLAIFSNLPSSGILAAFAGSKVLFALIGKLKNRDSWKNVFRSTMLYLLILVLWLVSAVFELSGGRAGSAAAGGVMQSIGYILEILSHPTVYCSKSFLLTVFLLLGAGAAAWLVTRKKDSFSAEFMVLTAGILVSAAALLVYMILLMAVVDWTAALRSEYLFGLFFYLILLLALALGYLLHRFPGTAAVVPLLLYVMVTCTNTNGQTFLESNMDNYPVEICQAISQDLVDQFVQADTEGLEHFELYVPVFKKEMNWPLFSGYNGFAIADSLYEHGVIKRRVEFTVVPTMERNQKHQLDLFW